MEAVFDCRQILTILPHRFPFLLVDKVVSKEAGPDASSRVGQKVVAVKNVTFNEPFFTGHFPGLPIMPGVLQMEALAQAACLAYYRLGDPERDFFIAALNDAKFRRPVVPGDVMMMYAEVTKDRGQMISLRVEARVNDQIVSEADILAKVTLKANRDKV